MEGLLSKNDIVSKINYANDYNLQVNKIKSSKTLTEEEKQLLIDSIVLPINHTRGYFAGDDNPDDVRLLSKRDRLTYGI